MDPVYRDRAALLGETLVVADLHLGKGAASSVELPLGTSGDVVDRIERLLERFDPDEVVLAGDVLHAFDYVPDAAAEALADLASTIRTSGAQPIVLRGNHDAQLDSVWDGSIDEEYVVSGKSGGERIIVCHGHEAPDIGPDTEADWYVMGHDHPAIVIEGQKRHCYLVGSGVYRGGDLLVLPAFNRLVEGVTVNNRIGEPGERSPLLTDIGQLRPIVYDRDADDVLEFPQLDQFQRML